MTGIKSDKAHKVKCAADNALWKKGQRLAGHIGLGYAVYGAGPGVELYSVGYPNYPLELSEALLDRLLELIEDQS